MTALWTEACLTLPALDALKEGHEVYVIVDAVGGTSVAALEAALRRIEQASGKMIGVPRLFCELQRDWTGEHATGRPHGAAPTGNVPAAFGRFRARG